MTAGTALAGLPPVSLTDLVADSALLTRVDRKYLLTHEDLDAALAGLPAGTRVLEIEGHRSQRYTSTYFDTPDRASYRSTATARRRRWKVRTRSYLGTGGCWLEVKTRGPRGTTVKCRQPHPGGMPSALTPAGLAFVRHTLADQQVSGAAEWIGAPALHTAYRRSTLALPEGARATIDTDLCWTGPDGTQLSREQIAVVETKAGSTPTALDLSLWAAGHRPVPLSKFATGLALLDPQLPAHRWHRLLTTGLLTA